jgi:DNA uptake protein ComE-like DNA-binding protein
MDRMINPMQYRAQRGLSSLALASLAVLASASLQVAAAGDAASGAASMPAPFAHDGTAPKNKAAAAPPVKLVDINSAGRKELKTLPGIGDAEAEKIIANRPYLTKTELVGKNVLPLGPYLSLKGQVIALPKSKAKGKSQPASTAQQGG